MRYYVRVRVLVLVLVIVIVIVRVLVIVIAARSDQAQPVMIDKLGPKSHFAKKEVRCCFVLLYIESARAREREIDMFCGVGLLGQIVDCCCCC